LQAKPSNFLHDFKVQQLTGLPASIREQMVYPAAQLSNPDRHVLQLCGSLSWKECQEITSNQLG